MTSEGTMPFVEGGVFGRTNQVFPARWLRLVAPGQTDVNLPDFVHTALEAKTVLDISAGPALWGGHLRGTPATLMTVGPLDLAQASGEQQAHDVVLAHLIETLSGIGREYIDMYFLLVGRALQEAQISGALIALEEARQEGNIRFVGLCAKDIFASHGLLHFHDAFEILLTDSAMKGDASGVRAMARSRRMALVSQSADLDAISRDGEATLYVVDSSADIDYVLQEKVALA